MSFRFSSIGLFGSFVAIAFAANHAGEYSGAPRARGPAAIATMQKEERLGEFKSLSGGRHTEKIRGPLSVTLEMIGTPPAVGETFVVRGTINSRRALTSANFAFSIPADVEVINGQVSGTVTNVDADQPAAVELTLRKLTSSSARVHFLANSEMGEIGFGDVAQLDTDHKPLASATQTASTKNLKAQSPAQDGPAEVKIFH